MILESITYHGVGSDRSVRAVPPAKIEANQLSESVGVILKTGMAKAYLVDEFCGKWHDPSIGDRVALAFRKEYESVRATMTPN
jgi:hypothetical protein